MNIPRPIFRDTFDFPAAIEQAKEQGYHFTAQALTNDTREALEAEIGSLPLEVGDHITNPINAGKIYEVQQQHERAYFEYGNTQTPVANLVIAGLTKVVRAMRQLPELSRWQPTEIGYQRYRHDNDWIGPHRDRASDKLLSATLTITGFAPVRIFEPLGDPRDYTQLNQTDEFITTPGSVMLLRAPGFGNGEQVIHQVLPPTSGSRTILNLRMRPKVLEQPSHPRWQG